MLLMLKVIGAVGLGFIVSIIVIGVALYLSGKPASGQQSSPTLVVATVVATPPVIAPVVATVVAAPLVVATSPVITPTTIKSFSPSNSPDIIVNSGELTFFKELYCMTLNIYREASNQGLIGMVAVGQVVMNRVADSRFPNTPCDVIYEGPVRESWKTRQLKDLPDNKRIYYPIRNRCQFSWYCDGKRDALLNTKNNSKWKLARNIAYEMLAYNMWKDVVNGATHYHAIYVKPKWSSSLQKITRIGDHIFYRWD